MPRCIRGGQRATAVTDAEPQHSSVVLREAIGIAAAYRDGAIRRRGLAGRFGEHLPAAADAGHRHHHAAGGFMAGLVPNIEADCVRPGIGAGGVDQAVQRSVDIVVVGGERNAVAAGSATVLPAASVARSVPMLSLTRRYIVPGLPAAKLSV